MLGRTRQPLLPSHLRIQTCPWPPDSPAATPEPRSHQWPSGSVGMHKPGCGKGPEKLVAWNRGGGRPTGRGRTGQDLVLLCSGKLCGGGPGYYCILLFL